MKTIALFGAGKSATVLIEYLIEEGRTYDWILLVADASKELIESKTKKAAHTRAIQLDISDANARKEIIAAADIVISMMPAHLHYLVATDCVELKKNLLTASYVDEGIRNLKDKIEENNLLFLCEIGLDPGIDHMSAMKLFHEIEAKGGTVTSFKSHCGGLVAPESDNNPWHYKISWNPRNVVMAGKAGATYKKDGKTVTVPYDKVFEDSDDIAIEGLDVLATYPNRDSLSYIPLYHLDKAETFVRTTLRYPQYCKAWDYIVDAGLTNDAYNLQTKGLTYKEWAKAITPFVNDENEELYEFIGLFDETNVPANAKSSADVMQHLLETKLAMQPHDKDMIVMLHEIDYTVNSQRSTVNSSLIVKGDDSLHTAMAKTVGLPLGIAAKLILRGKIQLTGIQIPVVKEIYEPVLEELAEQGIVFKETTTTV
ncbi:MAG: saccharopine dehydrogenase NADP-binding domain-containing protein [Sphingobacteriales bacterium]|nr:saccharopine dehydrogenase NADP-binding domain-containing protein [Sphingobacteriales bacterium]